MVMQAWLSLDGAGREVLTRSGAGRITAVVAVGDAREATLVYRVEIECETRPRPRAVRVSAHGLLAADDPLMAVALDAEQQGVDVDWTIEWARHPWVPDHLPISSLDLATDARATVTALRAKQDASPLVEPAGATEAARRRDADEGR